MRLFIILNLWAECQVLYAIVQQISVRYQNRRSWLLVAPSLTLALTTYLSSRASVKNSCYISSLEAIYVSLSVYNFSLSISSSTKCLQISASSWLPSRGRELRMLCIYSFHQLTSFLVISFQQAARSNSARALYLICFYFRSRSLRISLNYLLISCRMKLLSDQIIRLFSFTLASASFIYLSSQSIALMLDSLSRLMLSVEELLGVTEWFLCAVLPYRQFTQSSRCSSAQYSVMKLRCFRHFWGSQWSQHALYRPNAVLQFYFLARKLFTYSEQSDLSRIDALVGEPSSRALRAGCGEVEIKGFFRAGPIIFIIKLQFTLSINLCLSRFTPELVSFT